MSEGAPTNYNARRQFFVSVSTQFENVGDALIYRELIVLAARSGKVVVDLSRCPERFVETLGIEDLDAVETMRSRGEFYRRMARSSLSGLGTFFLLKPGAYFGRGLSTPLRSWSLLTFWAALKFLGVKLVQVGASYEQLEGRAAAFYRRRANLLDAHYVRDGLSAQYAGELNIPTDGVLPDLAFNIVPSSTDRRVSLNRQAAFTIGLSFRCGQYPAQKRDVLDLLCRLLASRNCPSVQNILIVSQVSWDLELAHEIARDINEHTNAKLSVLECHEDISKCQQAYERCDLLVSNRLHALLLAASVGTPGLAFVHPVANRKIIGVFEDNGWSDRLIYPSSYTDAEDRSVPLLTRVDRASRSPMSSDQVNDLRSGFASIVEDLSAN